MKIYISDTGDRSVGIQPTEVEVSINIEGSDFIPKERREIKNDLIKLFQEWGILTSRINYCFFDDECPECGCYLQINKETNKRRCTNSRCVINLNNGELS